MVASLSLPWLISCFVISAVIVWVVGIKLTHVTDILDCRFNIGQAFGGVMLLAVTTNLTEIAIVVSAALAHDMGIITGNIFGGIAIQTVVLVVLDGLGLRSQGALTYKPITLQLVLSGLLVIFLLLIAMMASQLPENIIFYRIAPGDIAIVISWLAGLWLIRKSGRYLPWKKRFKQTDCKRKIKKLENKNTIFVVMLFIFLALLTLLVGWMLEESSGAIAKKLGWSSTVFAATILAAVTALPQLSTGLAAIKLHDYTLAVSDIFGGNAFLPVLFMLGTTLSGTAVLTHLQHVDIYLASLGGLLIVVYLCGLIFSVKRQIFWLGIDSLVVLLLYILGVAGLFFINN